jgi:hypothetical protein
MEGLKRLSWRGALGQDIQKHQCRSKRIVFDQQSKRPLARLSYIQNAAPCILLRIIAGSRLEGVATSSVIETPAYCRGLFAVFAPGGNKVLFRNEAILLFYISPVIMPYHVRCTVT